jgi:hypothetical protein
LLSQFAICRARAFDQGDGLRQNGPIAVQDAIDNLLAR